MPEFLLTSGLRLRFCFMFSTWSIKDYIKQKLTCVRYRWDICIAKPGQWVGFRSLKWGPRNLVVEVLSNIQFLFISSSYSSLINFWFKSTFNCILACKFVFWKFSKSYEECESDIKLWIFIIYFNITKKFQKAELEISLIKSNFKLI